MSLLRRGSSDVEALDRSFRSRILLLGLLCVAAIGLATWSGMRDAGTGAAEDPRRVMIVTAEARSGLDYYPRLFERAGFVVEVEGLAGWEARARDYVADEDVQGLALVLEFADLGGYGFVVLEQPSAFDLDGLELEPTPDEIEDFAARDYAVLSIGDLAFPHRLSVDDPGEDPLLRVPGHGALQAIYRQPRLALDRELLVERPTVDELKLEDAIRFGRKLVDAPAGFPAMIDQVVISEKAALSGDAAKALVEPLHTGSPLPIAGGGALLLHHELVVYSDDAQTLELDGSDRLAIDWLSPEALEAGDPGLAVPCRDLLEGEVRLDRRPSFEVSRDGRVLAITTEREGSRAWRKLDEPGCRFVALGELPEREAGEPHFGELAPDSDSALALGEARSVLARIGQVGEDTRLRLWTTSGETWAPREQVLLELGEAELRMPTFLDDRRIALLSRTLAASTDTPAVPADALHVVDRRRPGAHLRIPAEFIGEGVQLRELAWLPRPSASAWNLGVLVTAIEGAGEVRVLELALTDEAAARLDLALAVVEPEAVEPGPDALPGPALETIAPEELLVRSLVERDDLLGVAVDPRGRWLALVVGSELALYDRELETTRMLTDNGLRDYLPRFTDDGRALVFSSLMRVWISGRTFTVPRAIALP
ncbi:hypothetical protein ACNOYE_00165 [Nannocystaceae bacterium ST9]